MNPMLNSKYQILLKEKDSNKLKLESLLNNSINNNKINSSANDYALTIRKDLKSGYFTSERSTAKNRTYTPDIYSFTTPQKQHKTSQTLR